MTITSAELIKHQGRRDKDGTEFDVAYRVEFTGVYNPVAAATLAEVTDVNGAHDISIGAALSESESGVVVLSRAIEFGVISTAGMPGEFTINLRYGETSEQFNENPLLRKDVASFRREPVEKSVAIDRAGRVIATYRTFEEEVAEDQYESVSEPIEVFATLPTTNTTRLTATITGYRSEYLLADQEWGTEGTPSNQQWTLVNNAPVEIDGRTYAAGQVSLIGCRASRTTINGYSVISHEWTLEFGPTFDLKVLNAGVYQWKDSAETGVKRQRIPDPAQAGYKTSPWPLDINGVALPENYQAKDLVYLQFAMTKPIDFSQFGWNF